MYKIVYKIVYKLVYKMVYKLWCSLGIPAHTKPTTVYHGITFGKLPCRKFLAHMREKVTAENIAVLTAQFCATRVYGFEIHKLNLEEFGLLHFEIAAVKMKRGQRNFAPAGQFSIFKMLKPPQNRQPGVSLIFGLLFAVVHAV